MRSASRLLLPRVVGALLLRPRTFREVAGDEGAGLQAGLLVVVVGIVEGTVLASVHGEAALDPAQVLYSVFAALIGWVVWGGIVFLVAARLFEYSLELRPVLRAVAFAHSPSLVYALAALPGLTGWAGLLLVASLVWFAAAMVACVEGVLEVSLGRALGVCAVALVSHEVLHQALRLLGAMD